MKSPKVAVILFPGSNCELEALRAVRRAHMEAKLIRWNDHSKKLSNYDAFILPGGFSYEDRGRSGVVASKDPIMKNVAHEGMKGKPILGICNGAQILVETGMIPGLEPENLEMALAWNERISNGKILGVGYYNDWVYIRHASKPGRSVFNNFPQKNFMQIPVAHGEGRFTTKDKTILKKLIANNQTLFRYCDAKGKFIDEYPINPNGAIYNLAGVCNPEGNIMALMPHPERTIKGQAIFDSIAAHLKSSRKIHIKKPSTIKLSDPLAAVEKQKKNGPHSADITILVRLIITDNEERTIENTLKNMGYKDVSLYRQTYLGFFLKSKKNLEQNAVNLIKSGEILNLNKETPTIFIKNKIYKYSKEKGLAKIADTQKKEQFLIALDYDNFIGKNIFNNVKHIKGLQKVERGIHWHIRVAKTTKKRDIGSNKLKEIIGTHIFHNPHSMKLLTA